MVQGLGCRVQGLGLKAWERNSLGRIELWSPSKTLISCSPAPTVSVSKGFSVSTYKTVLVHIGQTLGTYTTVRCHFRARFLERSPMNSITSKRRGGNSKCCHLINGSSQGQHLAVPVLHVPNSLDSGRDGYTPQKEVCAFRSRDAASPRKALPGGYFKSHFQDIWSFWQFKPTKFLQ